MKPKYLSTPNMFSRGAFLARGCDAMPFSFCMSLRRPLYILPALVPFCSHMPFSCHRIALSRNSTLPLSLQNVAILDSLHHLLA